MSTLSYNGISLIYVKTELNAREAVYSQDGSDLLYVKFTMEFTAIYNPEATSYLGGVYTRGIFPVVTDVQLRRLLMEPRKTLIYTDGEHEILRSPPADRLVDAVNGPIPLSLHITDMVGTKTWLVRWRVETCLNECSELVGPLVSNRWTQAHSVGDNHLTAITTSGIAHFRMDALSNLERSADSFRNLCLPPIPSYNFRRMSVQISVNPIGNILQYTVSDVEQYVSLGDEKSSKHPDVLTFDGSYSQHTSTGEGGMPSPFIFQSFTMQVMGTPKSLRYNLIRFAVAMGTTKLKLTSPGVMTTSVSVTESLNSPAITLQIQAKMPSSVNAVAGLAGLRSEFFLADGAQYQVNNPNLANDGKNPQFPNASNSRGQYKGELFAAALAVACQKVAPVKPSFTPQPGKDTPSIPKQPPEISISVDDFNKYQTKYSGNHDDDGSYTDAKFHTHYKKKSGIISVPTTGRVIQPGQGFQPPYNPQGDEPQAQFIKTSGATSVRVTEWTVERTGKKPTLPSPALDDPNFVMLETSQVNSSVGVGVDGVTPVFRVSGKYTYGARNAVGAGDQIPFDVLPNIESSYGYHSIVPSDYQQGIISGYGQQNGQQQTNLGSDI